MDWVNKQVLKQYKDEFRKAIEYIQPKLTQYSFQYSLVGSAKRNLVLKHHNKGFDLDYQIQFQHSIRKLNYKQIKDDFRLLLDEYFTTKGYNNGEDSTSAITIKMTGDSKIINAYDIALINKEADGLYIIRYIDDEKIDAQLEKLPHSYEYMKKYSEIKGQEMWNDLRTIYKDKKENNLMGKYSFTLLAESVKELFDRYPK